MGTTILLDGHHGQARRRAGWEAMSPARVLVLSFFSLIVVGGLLLSLPVASSTSEPVPFLDALFTSTSAVCVTGLTVVDTGTRYSLFGQLVILLLIQFGALGILTMATLIAIVLRRRINLRERLILQEAFSQFKLAGVVDLVRRVFFLAMATEGTGAALLAIRFVPQFGWERGLYFSVFHAVSAFANAGLDLMGHFRSFTGYVTDPLVSLTIAGLLIVGGIGFTVLLDLGRHRRWRDLSLHSKLALTVTGILLGGGTLLILLAEWNNPATLGGLSWPAKLLAAFFQSATARTAGFNTVDIGRLHQGTQFLLIILMFIGASPASTGGGIKTTTAGALAVQVASIVQGRSETHLFGRRLCRETTDRALAVAALSLLLVVGVTVLMSFTEHFGLLRILFEATSAFGTVGLSTGITPYLGWSGKVLLILLMFAGRVGPVTLALALAAHQHVADVRLPEDRVMVG